MSLPALLALAAATPPVSPAYQATVDRFVAACTSGQTSGSELYPVAERRLPASLRRRYGNVPEGRYYRFRGDRPSYLLVLHDSRPGAPFSLICAVASTAGTPWQLYQGAMDALYPEESPRARRRNRTRHTTTIGAATVNDPQGWTIEASRVGPYTVLAALHHARKEAPPAGAGVPAGSSRATPIEAKEQHVDPR